MTADDPVIVTDAETDKIRRAMLAAASAVEREFGQQSSTLNSS